MLLGYLSIIPQMAEITSKLHTAFQTNDTDCQAAAIGLLTELG
jgi:hypothetical protein